MGTVLSQPAPIPPGGDLASGRVRLTGHAILWEQQLDLYRATKPLIGSRGTDRIPQWPVTLP
jgi:hypothetical protein